MGLVLIGVGCALIAAGLLFALKNRGSEAAGLQFFKVNISGQAWLILVAMGVACLFGVWYIDGTHATPKAPPSEVLVTTPVEASFEASAPDEPFDYGDDADLDMIYDDCTDGAMQACDDLYQDSPSGSQYEYVGATCGLIYTEDDWPESCVDAPLDLTTSDDTASASV